MYSITLKLGRGSETRTHDTRFWRPGHVPRPRNFMIENEFSSESFLADCLVSVFTLAN